MHIYWRIIEELKYLGECWTINDPCLLRYYESWVRKNAEAIALEFEEDLTTIPTLFTYKDIPFSLN